MLQDADPNGTAHIRMNGGVPIAAELKAGYWDGPYSYIDEEGNWVYSSEGTKVDLWCNTIDEFVDELVDTFNIPEWEDVKKKFKFKLTYSNESQRKEREDVILKQAKTAYDDDVEMHKKIEEEYITRALENESKGWKWFQNKLVDDKTITGFNHHHYYTWKVFNEKGKEESSNVHNVHAVYKSGLFERVDNNKIPGYYEWIKK